MGNFDESKHPRDKGKFTSGGGTAREVNAAPSLADGLDASKKASDLSSDANIKNTAEAHLQAATAHREAAAVIKARGGDYQTHLDKASNHEAKAKAAPSERERGTTVVGMRGVNRAMDKAKKSSRLAKWAKSK